METKTELTVNQIRLAQFIEELRKDFVENDQWRGMDLVFSTYLEMSLDIPKDMAQRLIDIANANL